ncbi:MAG TPA: iron-sulfur cluster assembly scaffold protein [Candidatus Colwellbacteria bacterium]|nr:iron-sulfur cluster assembly scaffold protein [Candidatus Colwellbacteria bacterium]HQA96071.1 iron-sulfur cluster assembly scaffold protein [Candidatus Colwellbacteria bacterium]
MEDFYREEFMDIFRHPHNRGTLENPSVFAYKKNPMCGDSLVLRLKIKDGIIEDAKFEGEACAVSIISSSILTDYLIGKSVDEAKKINKDRLLEMISLNLTTSRISCAALVLYALEEALKNYENKKSE